MNTNNPVFVLQHPAFFDYISVAAIILGPVLALFAQRVLDQMREKRKRRVQLYETALTLRASWLNPLAIRELNAIDFVFAGGNAADRNVRDAWAALISHAYTVKQDASEDQAAIWNRKMEDLRIDLYIALGKAVGKQHTIDYLKTHFYNPGYFNKVEMESEGIREGMFRAISNGVFRVELQVPPADASKSAQMAKQ